jgi:hypothetical protein
VSVAKRILRLKFYLRLWKRINKELDTPRPWGTYWICKKQRGNLSEIMQDLLQRMEECKALGLILKEKALAAGNKKLLS